MSEIHLPLLPGCDVLGFGFNLCTEEFRTRAYTSESTAAIAGSIGVKIPCNPTQYRQPTAVDMQVKIETRQHVESYLTKDDYNKKRAAQYGLAYREGMFTGFDGGHHFPTDTSLFDENTANVGCYQVASQISAVIYKLYLKPPKDLAFSNSFTDAMNGLPEIDETSDEVLEPYLRFIAQFGTHYIRTANVGGKITMRTFFNRRILLNYAEVETAVTRAFCKLFPKGDLTEQMAQDLDVRYKTLSTSNVSFMGGSYGFHRPIAFHEFKGTDFDKWLNTVYENPVVISFTLGEMSELFTTSIRNKLMKLATTKYFENAAKMERSFRSVVPPPSLSDFEPHKIIEKMKAPVLAGGINVQRKKIKHSTKSVANSFTGQELIAYLEKRYFVAREDAIELVDRLIRESLIFAITPKIIKYDDENVIFSLQKIENELSVDRTNSVHTWIKNISNSHRSDTSEFSSRSSDGSSDYAGEEDSTSELTIRGAMASSVDCTCEHNSKNYRIRVKLQELVWSAQNPNTGVPLKTRKFNFDTVKDSFSGLEMLQWLTSELQLKNKQEAERIIQKLLDSKVIIPVQKGQKTIDEQSFYLFHKIARPADPTKTAPLNITPL